MFSPLQGKGVQHFKNLCTNNNNWTSILSLYFHKCKLQEGINEYAGKRATHHVS